MAESPMALGSAPQLDWAPASCGCRVKPLMTLCSLAWIFRIVTSTKPHFHALLCASTRRGASSIEQKFLHWNLTTCSVSSLCITLTQPATSHRASRNTSHPPLLVRRRPRTSRKHTQPSHRPSHQPTAPSARSWMPSSPCLPSHSSSYLP
jgi:hypothetical protein